MTCEPLGFKSVDSIGYTMLMNELEINLKYWFDWSFLKIGAWNDVQVNTAGAYGGDVSQLRPVEDPNPEYSNGQVWEACRKDWIWENGISYTNPFTNTEFFPESILVYINGVGASSPYIVNYPQGQIIFDDPISTTSEVKAQYSSRGIQVSIADDSDWWNQLQYKSFNVEDSFFLQIDKGNWTIGSEQRVQMPAIIIESVPSTKSRGYQIGDGSLWVQQDVYCHVIAEDRRQRNRIMDILLRQQDKTIQLFNSDDISRDNAFPLDYRGTKVDGSHYYPFLAAQYPYSLCRFSSTSSFKIESINPKLFNGIVKMTCEVALDE